MMHLRMISKSNSGAAQKIRKLVGIEMYTGKINKAQVLINYGLAGKCLLNYYKKVPSAKDIPTLNNYVSKSKYGEINTVKGAGILTPDITLVLPDTIKVNEWLEKRIHSAGNFGIRKAIHGRRRVEGKYFQKLIHNKLYELRIHAFLWTTGWTVQRRVVAKERTICNLGQREPFITVNPNSSNMFLKAREISKKILEINKKSFGTIDFVVDKDYKLYFVEVNPAPKFTDLSSYIYSNAFRELKNLSLTEIKKLVY